MKTINPSQPDVTPRKNVLARLREASLAVEYLSDALLDLPEADESNAARYVAEAFAGLRSARRLIDQQCERSALCESHAREWIGTPVLASPTCPQCIPPIG